MFLLLVSYMTDNIFGPVFPCGARDARGGKPHIPGPQPGVPLGWQPGTRANLPRNAPCT